MRRVFSLWSEFAFEWMRTSAHIDVKDEEFELDFIPQRSP